MAPIQVPKPPRKAFNPRRPAGTLLQNQLRHLEWAVRPAAARTHDVFHITPARTEAEAARRIHQLTVELQRQAASQVSGPAAGAATTSRTPSRTRVVKKAKRQVKRVQQTKTASAKRTGGVRRRRSKR